MSDTPAKTDPAATGSDLQFDRAEVGDEQPGTIICAACKADIGDAYYTAGDVIVCPACREMVAASQTGGSRTGRLAKAALFGALAGLGGAAIWYAVRRITGHEIGLIAILVGLMVGGAVRAGSARRGGRGYQVLAVLLTYCAIAMNYVPDIVEALVNDRASQAEAVAQAEADVGTASPDPPAAERPGAGQTALALVVLVAMVFALALAAPFLAGTQSIIWLLIIGFALWEAWKMNRAQQVTFAGPFTVAPSPTPPATAGA